MFLLENVFDGGRNGIRYTVDAMRAVSSNGLTALAYYCESENKSGVLLGFYGYYKTSSGVPYMAYRFKNLPEVQALEMLTELLGVAESNKKYVNSGIGRNAGYTYDDLYFVVAPAGFGLGIDVSWDGFYSSWKYSELKLIRKKYDEMLRDK